MTESKVSKATRENLDAEKYFYYIEAIKTAINTAVEQGLWIAIMVDMLGISGKVPKQSFLGKQRRNLIELLDALTKKDLIKNLFDIGNIPNPGYYIFRWLRPLKDELEKDEKVGEAIGPHNIVGLVDYYSEMEPIPRMILVFVFPGALKLLAAQIGEIIPG